jgi:hypothetical protein
MELHRYKTKPSGWAERIRDILGDFASSEMTLALCWAHCGFQILGCINPLQGLLIARTSKLLPKALLTAR